MTQLTEPNARPSSDPEPSISAPAREEVPGFQWPSWHLFALIAGSAIVLFIGAALRHHAFRSGAMDLGFFDQLTYLISRGLPPVSSIVGFHLLSDHAAYMLYLIAPLYWLWPNAHVLLLVQAVALASGAYPIYRIAVIKGLDNRHALALAVAYLMYPVVLAVNLFDFHPEVISVIAILFAVLAALRKLTIDFVIAVLLALGGKEIISLTVVAMGVWLALFERRRLQGAIAIVMGAAWFAFATQWLIPHFGAGKEASGVRFFLYLGSSVSEIVKNLVLQPQRWVKVVFSFSTIKYLFILFAPVAWGLIPRHRKNFRYLAPLIVCAAPTLALNILAQSPIVDLRRPFSQYSLMVVPFLAITFVYAVAAGQAWLMRPRNIAIWSISLVLLGAGARLAMVRKGQATDLPSQNATREAMQMVAGSGGVLTSHEIVPHLSDRKLIQYVGHEFTIRPIDEFEYVLLNLDHDSVINAGTYTTGVLDRVRANPAFKLEFDRDSVLLFRKADAPLRSK
ncbi:DUF2079 domain-containing protein [soil metagenome]